MRSAARLGSLSKWLCASAALLLVGLAGAEGTLQLAALTLPAVRDRLNGGKPHFVTDARLGVRGDPLLVTEHDARGFRNARLPRPGDIMAIGDSQTEGAFVERADAWPQQLAAGTGLPVYQMAFGSYGPPQYELLVEDAIAFKPRAIIVALYFGNDFGEAYDWVYEQGRSPALRSTDEGVLRELEAARTAPALSDDWQATKDAFHGWARSPATRWVVHEAPRLKLVQLALRLRVARVGTANQTATQPSWDHVLSASAGVDPNFLFPFADSRVRTAFTPRARLAVLRSSDARVREGTRIALRAIERMQIRCTGRAPFAVLLIPTKELVFAEELRSSGVQIPAALSELIASEAALRFDLETRLSKQHVRWIDPLPALRNVIQLGRNPYRIDWDGHPNRLGHRILAEGVATSEFTSAAVPQ